MDSSIVQQYLPGPLPNYSSHVQDLGEKRRVGNAIKFSSKSKGESCLLAPMGALLANSA